MNLWSKISLVLYAELWQDAKGQVSFRPIGPVQRNSSTTIELIFDQKISSTPVPSNFSCFHSDARFSIELNARQTLKTDIVSILRGDFRIDYPTSDVKFSSDRAIASSRYFGWRNDKIVSSIHREQHSYLRPVVSAPVSPAGKHDRGRMGQVRRRVRHI